MCTRDLDLGYGDVLWRFKLVKYWHRLKVQPLPSVFAKNGSHMLLKKSDNESESERSFTTALSVSLATHVGQIIKMSSTYVARYS